MKLQLLCMGAVVLIQSAFVASHEVPSFRGVSLLGDHDAKDAAVAPVKPAETDAPEKKDELAGRRRGKTWKTDAPEKKDELADETEERPKSSVIAVSTALADARIGTSGRFCSGLQSSATSMVHLRPILAIARWSTLPCFVALGFVLFGFGYRKHPCANWFEQRVTALIGEGRKAGSAQQAATPTTPSQNAPAAVATPSPPKPKTFFNDLTEIAKATVVILSHKDDESQVSKFWGKLLKGVDEKDCGQILEKECVAMRETLKISDGTMPNLNYVQIVTDLKEMNLAQGGKEFSFARLAEGISLLITRELTAEEITQRDRRNKAEIRTRADGNMTLIENLDLLKRDPPPPADTYTKLLNPEDLAQVVVPFPQSSLRMLGEWIDLLAPIPQTINFPSQWVPAGRGTGTEYDRAKVGSGFGGGGNEGKVPPPQGSFGEGKVLSPDTHPDFKQLLAPLLSRNEPVSVLDICQAANAKLNRLPFLTMGGKVTAARTCYNHILGGCHARNCKREHVPRSEINKYPGFRKELCAVLQPGVTAIASGHDIRARKKIEPAWQNKGSNNDREGDRQTREKFKSNNSRKKIRFEETHDVMFDGA
ncbi:hypothetical protein THAOC_25472, partial [Thalassiosira oceanica]